MAVVDAQALESDLRGLVGEIVEIEPEKVTLEANFVDDLGMDSMMALEILASIEKKYELKIPEDYLGKISSLKSLVDLTKSFIEKK